MGLNNINIENLELYKYNKNRYSCNNTIDKFRGEYYFLSNFYRTPINYNGLIFKSVEAAFQAQKTTDIELQRQFTALNPKEAKRLGRQLQLRADWEVVKDFYMYDILKVKFNIPYLREKLLDTGNAYLVEGNIWGDKYWGVCKGEGQNKLGKILMKIREELS